MAEAKPLDPTVQIPKLPPKGTTSRETVTVACKLPHGLKLRVFKFVERDEPILGGGVRTVKIAHELDETATVCGIAHDLTRAPEQTIIHGFALTHGIDKELWELWLEQNKRNPIVISGLIFAHSNDANIRAEASEKKNLRTGMEPLDPDNLPKGVGKIKTFNAKEAAN
jgi:hypothetical protein